MPTFAGNKHFAVQLLLHRPRPFNLSTQQVRFQSLRDGHQTDYSRAVSKSNNINKVHRSYPYGETKKIASKNN